MFCSTCGKEINDNAVVCPNCGCLVKKEETPQAAGQERKINAMCLVGFILSMVSLFIALFGTIAVAGFVLSLLGVIQAGKNNEKLKGLGIAGIVVSAISLCYTILVLLGVLVLLA